MTLFNLDVIYIEVLLMQQCECISQEAFARKGGRGRK
jgi:hypothetical protein